MHVRYDESDEEVPAVIFYSEGLSNHATSYMPSAIETNHNKP